MKIAFLLSTRGGSPLQVGLERGMTELGHDCQEYVSGAGYDLVLVFNQTAHNPDYTYPLYWPSTQTPIAFIDSAEYGYFRRLPTVIREYANAFAPGSMVHDTKNAYEQARLRRFLQGRSFPYFIREFSTYIDFPESYHPIDYPLYKHSECHARPERGDYLRRQLDLFVSWGASHPWRHPITQALRDANTKCEIQIVGEPGPDGLPVPRMPQEFYFQRTRAAKCSVSFDGYGSGSFRVTEVLVRTLLLQGPLSIRLRDPLIDGVHCREYRVWSDGETFLRTDIADVLRNALADPEGSYRIHEAAYDHCMTHWTEKATAEYVLRVINEHDWSRPTELNVLAGQRDEDGEAVCAPAGRG